MKNCLLYIVVAIQVGFGADICGFMPDSIGTQWLYSISGSRCSAHCCSYYKTSREIIIMNKAFINNSNCLIREIADTTEDTAYYCLSDSIDTIRTSFSAYFDTISLAGNCLPDSILSGPFGANAVWYYAYDTVPHLELLIQHCEAQNMGVLYHNEFLPVSMHGNGYQSNLRLIQYNKNRIDIDSVMAPTKNERKLANPRQMNSGWHVQKSGSTGIEIIGLESEGGIIKVYSLNGALLVVKSIIAGDTAPIQVQIPKRNAVIVDIIQGEKHSIAKILN
jgi:hypothetical protein